MTGQRTRIAPVVIGTVLVLIGLAAGAAGGILHGVLGSDGTVASRSHPISTSRTALVSSVADIDDTAELADLVGDPRVRLTAKPTGSARRVFVGIGPAAQVERYLASVPVDEVTDFEIDPFQLERKPHPGTRRPQPPASQSFWVAKGTGPQAATLRWKVRDGDYRLVLMNADGSRGVSVDGDVRLTVPHVARIAWVLVGGGIVLLLGGGVAIVAGLRGRR